jgi:hypothetical protein
MNINRMLYMDLAELQVIHEYGLSEVQEIC